MSKSEDLISKIDILRHGNKEFITNAVFPTKHLMSLANSNEIITNKSGDAIIILLEEEQLIRLYFYAANIESLRYIPLLIPQHINKPVIADIVGKNPNTEKLSIEFEKHNFCKHNELIRMNRKTQEGMLNTVSNVVFAEADNVNEIMDILYAEFDIFTSRLPTLQKLEEAIFKREITIVKQQDMIVGLAYFEVLGKRLKYLYQIAVRKDYRGRGIADDLLMYTFRNTSQDIIFQLWVETQNKPAIRKYQKHCFTPDGLIDYIMLYKGNDNGKDI